MWVVFLSGGRYSRVGPAARGNARAHELQCRYGIQSELPIHEFDAKLSPSSSTSSCVLVVPSPNHTSVSKCSR